MAGKTDSIAVTARIPTRIFERMEREAENSHSTMTRVIVKALEEYLTDPCPACDGTGVKGGR